jgi:two-component system NarL family response regulator
VERASPRSDADRPENAENGGLEVIARIRAEQADASVVILTMFDGDEGIFRAVKAGARGYLLKDASPEELLVCVRSVCEGRSYFPTGIAARLANRISSNTLTDREQEVLIRVSKLDATSRTEAVAIARRRGLIETD